MAFIHKLINQLHFQRILIVLMQVAAGSIFAGVLVFAVSDNVQSSVLSALGIFLAGIGFSASSGRLKKPSSEEIARFLDRNFPFMEESSRLLLMDTKNGMEQWQKELIEERLESHSDEIILPKKKVKNAAGFAGVWILLSALTLIFHPVLEQWKYVGEPSAFQEEEILNEEKSIIPELGAVTISINPPAYTGKAKTDFSWENISTPDQSEVNWFVTVNGEVDSVQLIFSEGMTLDLNKKNGFYSTNLQATENGIYQIRMVNADTTVYSDFKSIRVINDDPPGFVVQKPENSRSFINQNERDVEIDVEVGDDYGITQTKINATLARGSGENVRFRERTLSFENLVGIGSSEVSAKTILNADSLEMEPGDELYFYVTATDNRPSSQTARSDTYFIIYADTADANQGAIAGVAVDLMPEYFRSQRQIIIDTEQLMDEKPAISEKDFNSRSNEIGYNQGLLRKRYGEYLGLDGEGAEADEDHAEEEHQAELNEMGMENKTSDAAGAIPEEFFHDHGAAEMNTLFAESPRAMLKQALDNMWNAERYLRTNRPEEALPFEYAALELLKKVQQADRRYTRKAGYELPPIPVDEKRLTGTFDDFANPEKQSISELEKDPLNQLQILFKDSKSDDDVLAEQAMQLLGEADIPDSDRLYLLNRIRIIENEGVNDEIVKEILTKLNQIERVYYFDPTPDIRPILKRGSN